MVTYYHSNKDLDLDTHIFVFGSNKLGIHGAGAAKYAVKFFKAKYGVGEGLQGRSYAIPTKLTPYKFMSLEEIREGVDRFLDVASNMNEIFYLTPIGTGLGNHKHKDIANLFKVKLLDNILYPYIWSIFLEES